MRHLHRVFKRRFEAFLVDGSHVTESDCVRVHVGADSLGGWIAVNFALRHPERVAHLAPMASAGVPPAPEQLGELLGTWKGRFFDHIWKTGSPGAFMRFFGPMGPSMAGAYVRRRLLARNISDDERQALRDYMFQSTAAPSSFDEVVPSVFALGVRDQLAVDARARASV